MGKIWTANEIWTLIFAKASRDIIINMYLNRYWNIMSSAQNLCCKTF